MSIYAIGDIHGAYDELLRLLHKINFRYDGSDELYFLGDYIDWGKRSMDTLQFIRSLDTRYGFVHCILGNHEAMFLETIDSGFDGENMNGFARNWLEGNHGLSTWNDYLKLTLYEREELIEWLRSLRLSFEVSVGGVNYMLAHAYPYYYDVKMTPSEQARRRIDSVWRRLLIRENPFGAYPGDRVYHRLICGHTISDYYYQQLRYEKNWPFRKPAQSVRNRIFFGEMFIDIDCGAKCLNLPREEGGILQLAAMRAQLAALRLDDLQGFYVHQSTSDVTQSVTAGVTQSLTQTVHKMMDQL